MNEDLGLDTYDGLDGEPLYTEEEVHAGSGRTTKFTHADVKLAKRRILAAGVLPEIEAWRESDRTANPKGPGGRPPTTALDDIHILVAYLLLVKEHTPTWTKEVRNLFWFRLTPQAREFLGIDHIHSTGDHHQQAKTWYSRVDRALHRLIDTMDPYPALRRAMNRAERDYQLTLRERNSILWNLEEKLVRKDRFSFLMTEMTQQMVPADARAAWEGSVSIDQTFVSAASPRGFAKGESKNPDIDSIVMEMDARWHTRDPERRGKKGADNPKESSFGYEANFAVQVAEDPYERAPHPLLVVGFSLSRPSEDVGGEAVKLLESLVGAGYKTGRVTTDKEYAANMKPENYYYKVRALGYEIVTDYHKDELGIMGGQRGAKIVDGTYVCPVMPDNLVNANKDYVAAVDARVKEAEDAGAWLLPDAHKADKILRSDLLKESAKYAFRQKEKPDEHGSVKMMCPAYGPGATAICPLREQHPKSSKKDKAVILDPPDKPDDCCTKTSVTMFLVDDSRYLQHLQYRGPQWKRTYKVDRNTVESFNAYVKDPGKENLGNSAVRRLRGLAAQQFAVTFLVVSANMRKVFKFRQDLTKTEQQRTPRKPRERNHLSLKKYRVRIAAVREILGLTPIEPPTRV